jgi:hypothetical protein
MKRFTLINLIVFYSTGLLAQPQPGDVFREYIWLPDMVAESAKFLRVGGKLDYKINTDHFPQDMHDEGHIPLEMDMDLKGAIKAELVLEKVQSHEDTKGLQVQINRNLWLNVPDAEAIPKPQSAYMHHCYPVVPIPLKYLNEGTDNTIKLKVDPDQKWNWPQNIFYGLIIRIYYNESKKHSSAIITWKQETEKIILGISPDIEHGNIERVEYIGLYEDYNYEGDGIFRQWHYHYFKGKIMNHIGTSNQKPFSVDWNISWVPDQEKEVRLGARIIDKEGIIYFTESDKLVSKFNRPYEVMLYRTYNMPENFVTRADTFITDFNIDRDLEKASTWQISWISWSPGYCNGIYVNDFKILDHEGPKYEYFIHLLEFEEINILKEGRNQVKTGKTPLYDGKMVHGMEVQWPGMMIKVKYRK